MHGKGERERERKVQKEGIRIKSLSMRKASLEVDVPKLKFDPIKLAE